MWEDSTKRFFLAHGRPFQPCQKMAWRWQTLCQVSCWDEFTLSHGSYVHLHLCVAPRPWTYRTVDQGAPAAAKRPQPMRKPKWFDSQFCQGLSPLSPAQSLCATWKDHKLVIDDQFFGAKHLERLKMVNPNLTQEGTERCASNIDWVICLA